MTAIVIILRIFGWFASIALALFAISLILMGAPWQGIVMMAAAILILPLTGRILGAAENARLLLILRGVAAPLCIVAFIGMSVLNPATSIYKDEEIEADFEEMYSEFLDRWPVSYEEIMVDTRWGKVHVTACGDPSAPPLVLVHASAVSFWSWMPQIEELSRTHRVYMTDTLGDAGRSELANLASFPKSGPEQADLILQVADGLGIDRCWFIGASEGGFISTNFALKYPERVQGLIMLAPMGYSAANNKTVAKIMLTQFFPVKPLVDSWDLAEFHPTLPPWFGEMAERWYTSLITGAFPRKARPVPYSPEEFRSLAVPVKLVLGTTDSLLGNPEAVRARVADIPNVDITVLDGGHMIGVEQPTEVNRIIRDSLRP